MLSSFRRKHFFCLHLSHQSFKTSFKQLIFNNITTKIKKTNHFFAFYSLNKLRKLLIKNEVNTYF